MLNHNMHTNPPHSSVYFDAEEQFKLRDGGKLAAATGGASSEAATEPHTAAEAVLSTNSTSSETRLASLESRMENIESGMAKIHQLLEGLLGHLTTNGGLIGPTSPSSS